MNTNNNKENKTMNKTYSQMTEAEKKAYLRGEVGQTDINKALVVI